MQVIAITILQIDQADPDIFVLLVMWSIIFICSSLKGATSVQNKKTELKGATSGQSVKIQLQNFKFRI